MVETLATRTSNETESVTVTPADMVARARELAPKLKERADQAQAERKVPVETIADYHRTGLIRIAQPRRYGGFEMGWDVLCEISQILAAADGSQAWIQRIMADHAQMVSTFPVEAQDDVWRDNHRALISAAFDPVGRAQRVKGGFRFSGRHGFSSGVDHADWMICGGFIVDGDKLDGPHFFLVPRADAKIIDDWHTMGLEGTGSKTFEVKDVFIPEHRRLDGKLAHVGQGPGTAVNKAAVYRTPRGGITSTGFAALAVGMAKGVLEEWLLYTAPRKSRGISVSEQPGTQMIAARASAEIESVEALYFGTITRAMRVLEAGGTLSSFDLVTARRNVAYTCKIALKAGTRLFNAGGGRALFRGQGLERQYRNLLGAASHHSAVWDANAMSYGKALIERYAR
ncbi:MAG: acyl-CoA dehydrogenase family protein [Gemmatimonas sp.]